MRARYVAAIDQGTTSTRFMVFDHSGRVITSAQKEHRQIYPQPGWVEHDPREIWQCTLDVIHAGLEREKVTTEDIVALGITNQRETTVVWDRKTGEPVCNAIVWQDTRTLDLCKRLHSQGVETWLRARAGLPLATYFSGPKLRWMLENIPGVRAKAERGDILFGTIDTWLIWNLTGGVRGGIHVTDVTNASRTMLMNLATLDWDPEALDVFGVPRAMLPEIVSSSETSGLCGAPLPQIPIAGVLGDQQAALFGQACFSPGEVKSTYGTGCFMLMNTGQAIVPSSAGLLTTVAYQLGRTPPVYALEGSIAVAGALVQWLRDNLGLIQNSNEIETLARTVTDNGGVYFVPAFAGLFAPYWRSDARGVIVGLTGYVTKGHLARAVLEATAWQTREVLDAMNVDAGILLHAMKVDGGMVHNELLMQFQADILGVPVIRPTCAETTALGAAYAAGLTVGVWRTTDELRANWGKDKEWAPSMEPSAREKNYHHWKRAVTRTFDWIED
ncbi:MAG: glycerol kinase GlpK [Deltaproteobacteria bacterium]|nr:glycerol kinase GlpK [Deltaproteobacteria bacterium]